MLEVLNVCFFWNKNRKNKKDEDKTEEIELIKLLTVNNSYELGIVESILKDNNIPYVVQETGANGYLKITTGALLVPTDIMVEKTYFEKAKNLTYMITHKETDKG